jgi:2-dehydropantoate 2-reductase
MEWNHTMNEHDKREYVILGAGAIGGTLAFYLARAGHPVLAVDIDADHVAAIRRNGITISCNGLRESVALSATTPPGAVIENARCVLICVKGVGATEAAVDWIAPRLSPDGFVVSMQNGLQVQKIAKRLGADRTVGAFVDFFADVTEPGLIVDGGAGTLRVGEIDGSPSQRVNQIVADLQAWGPASGTDNIMGYLWSKLGFSAMLAATALADAPMAALIDRHRDLMIALTREVFAVAATKGIDLEPFDSFDPAALMGDAASRSEGIDNLVTWLHQQTKTRSGVWRDIAIHHRPTEATGRYTDVIIAARDAGVLTPYLDALVDVLHKLETGSQSMSEENFEEIRQKVSGRSSV